MGEIRRKKAVTCRKQVWNPAGQTPLDLRAWNNPLWFTALFSGPCWGQQPPPHGPPGWKPCPLSPPGQWLHRLCPQSHASFISSHFFPFHLLEWNSWKPCWSSVDVMGVHIIRHKSSPWISSWITPSLFLAYAEMAEWILSHRPLALSPEQDIWIGWEFSRSSSAGSFLLNNFFLNLSLSSWTFTISSKEKPGCTFHIVTGNLR